MRREVQHGVRRPPRLVVIKGVLRKSAGVENAEVRVDARPPIGRRLAAIIKTGPDERTGKPRPLGEETPPAFGSRRPTRPDDIVGGDITGRTVIGVDAARANDAGLLAAKIRLRRMRRVI